MKRFWRIHAQRLTLSQLAKTVAIPFPMKPTGNTEHQLRKSHYFQAFITEHVDHATQLTRKFLQSDFARK